MTANQTTSSPKNEGRNDDNRNQRSRCIQHHQAYADRVVTSDKMTRPSPFLVERRVMHPVLGKAVPSKKSPRAFARQRHQGRRHRDHSGNAPAGSKTKSWKVLTLVEKARVE